MKLGAIARALDLRLEGDPDQEIRRVATIQSAREGELCFLANDRYRSFLAGTRAGAVILGADMVADCERPALISNNPYADYARAAKLLHPEPAETPGIHDTASVDAAAEVAKGVHVGPMAVIEGPVRLDGDVSVAAGAVISGEVRIGAGSRIGPGVVIRTGTRLGERCIVHGGVVIGADGFGFAPDQGEWVKVPQLGGVSIGSDVELGANTTVDRGAIDDTVIEDGVKLDNQVQVAHNVRIGRGTVIAGCTAVAGSTRIGRGCMIAGGVGIAGHLEIADGTVVTAMTLVSRSIRESGVYSGSLPMDDGASWKKNSARFRKLDELARRVRQLERALSDRGDTEQ